MHTHDGSSFHSSHSHSHSHSGFSHSHGNPTALYADNHSTPGDYRQRIRYRPTEADMDKLRSTIKQLVRDWSAEVCKTMDAKMSTWHLLIVASRENRKGRRVTNRWRMLWISILNIYQPMRGKGDTRAVSWLLPQFGLRRHKLRVLVPGAGLGRLAFDIAHMGTHMFKWASSWANHFIQFTGFSCQGNEYSHYMLLTSNFILNRFVTHEPPRRNAIYVYETPSTKRINEHTIYPHVHTLSCIPNRDALLRPITIPDVFPSDIPREVDFSYVAGERHKHMLFNSIIILYQVTLRRCMERMKMTTASKDPIRLSGMLY